MYFDNYANTYFRTGSGSGATLMTLLNNGNVGIGTTTPAVLLDVGYASSTIGAIATSSGVTDLVTLTGTYTGNTTQNLKIQITAASSTGDTFEWNVNGSTQNTGFIASTTAVALTSIGISVTFATTTGHTIGNYWTSTLTPSNGNINASNAYYLNEGLFASAFGTGNTSVGLGSMSANTTGNANTAYGYQALQANTTGSQNTANGDQALNANTTGSYNTANGYNALYSNTTGFYNTALGYQAGRYISGGSIANATSSNSLYLGYNTMALASGDTNEIVIGNGTVGLGSNTTVIGSSTATTLTALYGVLNVGTTTVGQATLTVIATTSAATSTIEIGSAWNNAGHTCYWNGSNYTIQSFASNSITPVYATSTTCK